MGHGHSKSTTGTETITGDEHNLTNVGTTVNNAHGGSNNVVGVGLGSGTTIYLLNL